MRAQLLIEGSDGGRTRKAKSGDPWRCLEYADDMPIVIVGTANGAVAVELYERDGAPHVCISRRRWKLDDNAIAGGEDVQVYRGPI